MLTELILRVAELIEGSSGRHDDGNDYGNRRFFISTVTRTVEDENHATVTKYGTKQGGAEAAKMFLKREKSKNGPSFQLSEQCQRTRRATPPSRGFRVAEAGMQKPHF